MQPHSKPFGGRERTVPVEHMHSYTHTYTFLDMHVWGWGGWCFLLILVMTVTRWLAMVTWHDGAEHCADDDVTMTRFVNVKIGIMQTLG